MRYALLISYDGTGFCGWQVQGRLRTVQAVLEQAAAEIFGASVKITGSGRTDAGVHARGQVCHFDADTTIPSKRLRECFNRILPPDVRVLESACAPQGFDCTRGAKKKTYCYRAYVAESELPLLERYYVRLPQKPDILAMRAAAALMTGEHDFKAFCAAGSSAKTSVRRIYDIDIREIACNGYTAYEIEVCGGGFLYNMVRIMAGELFAAGYGKTMDNLQAAFKTGKRALLAKTMPAKGLMMIKVDYGVPLFGSPEEN